MARTDRTPGPPAFVRLAAHPLRWQLLTALAESDYRVRELVSLLDQPQNLLSYHLRLLRADGLVSATRSSHDGRDTYYHLDLDRCSDALVEVGASLHPLLDPAADPDGRDTTARRTTRPRPLTVLFVCSGNSIRSPIAEALLRHHRGDGVHVTSAGTRPKPRLHADTVRVLGERFDIDVSGQQPRDVATMAGRRFDHVITLCDRAREACPEFAHQPRRAHWSLPDPGSLAGRAGYAAFQQVASDIDTRVRHLLPVLDATSRRADP